MQLHEKIFTFITVPHKIIRKLNIVYQGNMDLLGYLDPEKIIFLIKHYGKSIS